MKKMGASKHRRLKASPKGAQSHPRARRITTYYVGNVSAEMATVLRKDANILIRLREKLELQLCTVFHSARYPIILTRNAYQTHDDAKPRLRSSPLHTIIRQHCTKSNMQSREYKTENTTEKRDPAQVV